MVSSSLYYGERAKSTGLRKLSGAKWKQGGVQAFAKIIYVRDKDRPWNIDSFPMSFLEFCNEKENNCYSPILVPVNGLSVSFITPFCEPHIYNLNNFKQYDLLEWNKLLLSYQHQEELFSRGYIPTLSWNSLGNIRGSVQYQ